MKNDTYEQRQIEEINEWKQREPSLITQASSAMLMPLSWITEKLIPEAAMLSAIELAFQTGGMLTRTEAWRKSAGIRSLDELQTDLERCDHLIASETSSAIKLAAAEGGVLGACGLPGMVFDLPAIMTLSMRSIYLSGLCYGVDLNLLGGKNIAFQILAMSSSNSVRDKMTSLAALRAIQVALSRETFKQMAGKAAENVFSTQGAILTARNLARQLGVNLTKRKMAQIIPLLGAGIGAAVNACYIADVCECAKRTFQEIWLRRNGRWLASD